MKKYFHIIRSAFFSSRGFTLIELLIVIVIIAALAISVFIALNPLKRLQDSRNARRLTDIESIRNAINQYVVDNGALPAGLTAGMQETQIGTSNGTGMGMNNPSCINTTGSCNATAQSCVDLTSPLATYLKSIPHDPIIGSSSATGYSVSVDTNNSVIVKTCDTEGLAAGSNVQVDFTTPIVTLDPYAFSSTISTYGSGGGTIIASAKQRTELGNLKLGLYRIPLQWNGGNITSSAGGHPGGSGDAWVSNIIAFGGTPEVVIGGSTDNNFTAADAANLANHFNGVNGPMVHYFVVGNEPSNNGISINQYCTLFNQVYDAIKAVRPDINGQRDVYIDGPAWSYYDTATLQAFLSCAGSKVDIIDYHHYAMGSTYLNNTTALSQTVNWENEVTTIRQMINASVPTRTNQIGIQVGEYNWSWQTGDGYQGYNGDDRFYQAVATVWGASVAGHIARAGGHGNQYSDQNGALGITFETAADATHFGTTVDDPMPIYYGLEMFTGGNLFRTFGTQMVQASTTLPNVEVYASNNKNIVLINKDPNNAQTATIQLTGYTQGTVQVWQTDQNAPFSPPGQKTQLTIGTTFTYTLPPYSVTTFVLN